MPAPKGNSFWKLRSKHGANKIFSSPELFLAQAYEYFTNCDDNPWFKHEVIKVGPEAGRVLKVPIQRPYTIQGLCHYVGITEETFNNYCKSPGYEGFFGVFAHVRQIIENNQFEGATVGAYNASIIARKLGLVDKQDLTSKGESIKIILPNAD